MIIGQLIITIACSFFAGVLAQAWYQEIQDAKALKQNKRQTFIAPF